MTAALQLPSPLDEKRDWTVDDLASLPKDLRYELIDGRLVVSPSPTPLHQDLGVRLLLALEAVCPPDLMVVTDLSLRIDARSEPRPDVVVIDRKLVSVSPVPVEAAVLAVEVISPDSTIRDLHSKPRMLAKAGLPNYWVVDPFHAEGIVLAVFRLGSDGQYALVTETHRVFETDVPFPVTVDLPALEVRRRMLLGGSLPEV
ncbi:Uma2 family endonuclease [Actinoplanes sp. LDG1-06]|uniref:Uma2 family endonuclease n=1 Tax=Paractinoplanes ovalisporus TaxID=2810368 RepID=A0ABS2ACP5_9ACTN|nr:Uma2 family endonuclease [Actinoplanes ovalisporus]MBM2617597.1 Uma2 family endonuclease [Actinoplanes ovalisporus]